VPTQNDLALPPHVLEGMVEDISDEEGDCHNTGPSSSLGSGDGGCGGRRGVEREASHASCAPVATITVDETSDLSEEEEDHSDFRPSCCKSEGDEQSMADMLGQQVAEMVTDACECDDINGENANLLFSKFFLMNRE
jgi:hypothetical protein